MKFPFQLVFRFVERVFQTLPFALGWVGRRMFCAWEVENGDGFVAVDEGIGCELVHDAGCGMLNMWVLSCPSRTHIHVW